MPAATLKGRLTTAGTPTDIPISDILRYQDLYFSLDVRGLSITGSGSDSVVALLNTLVPVQRFPPGLRAYIASTVQNWSPAVYQSIRQISRTITVLVRDAGLANPTRNNSLVYRINAGGTSWEYVSG